MYPEQVELHEENIKKLTAIMKRAYAEVEEEILSATSFGVYQRRQIQANIRKILTELGVDVQKFLEEELSTYYKEGAADAVRQLEFVGADLKVAQNFSLIHKEAIAALVDDAARSFGNTLTTINRQASGLLSRAAKEEITQRLAIGRITGATRQEIAKMIKGILKEDGIAALVDKGGRRWELDTYTDMLVRTKAVEARNRGLSNRMVENGYDLVQVSSHGSLHAECAVWEGKILSLTGQTKGYPTVAQAESAGLFHPNCKHAINVITLGLAEQTYHYDTKTKRYVNAYGLTPPQKQKPNSRIPFTLGSTKIEFDLNDFESRLAEEKGLQYSTTKKQSIYGQFNIETNTLQMSTRLGKEFVTNTGAYKAIEHAPHTFYHEFGHFIDYKSGETKLSNKMELLRLIVDETEPVIVHRMAAYEENKQYSMEQIRTLARGGKIEIGEGKDKYRTGLPPKMLKYYRDKIEVFADAYAQYRTKPEEFKKYAPKLYKYFEENLK